MSSNHNHNGNGHNDHNPHETPRLPGNGSHKLTMPVVPLEPGACPLDEQVEMQVRIKCWRCKGHGTLESVGMVRCDAPNCAKLWPTDKIVIKQHMLREVWEMPCGHACPPTIDVQYTRCPTCGGGGYLFRWLPFGAFLDWVDQQYASISQAMTARRAATR